MTKTSTPEFDKSSRGSLGLHLPVRCQWLRKSPTAESKIVVAGTPGAHGDAGWHTIECGSRKELEALAAEYPQARMPCWHRLGL